ncbi:HAH_0734 family protein [Halorussus lipolyticus]|uniref:HAH_0734 family protein n=1 Tax=Halorussus lipolyticus TaxID=3034024 RepID=UPI0023E76CC2|nr:HAH_0734 family protein [Halorussus sp. DT80]
MKRLIIHGDPGIRKDATIEYDGGERVCFSISRQGDWHGPDEPQLWCIIGTEEERDDFDRQNFVPHWLETESIDADAVDVIQGTSEMTV